MLSKIISPQIEKCLLWLEPSSISICIYMELSLLDVLIIDYWCISFHILICLHNNYDELTNKIISFHCVQFSAPKQLKYSTRSFIMMTWEFTCSDYNHNKDRVLRSHVYHIRAWNHVRKDLTISFQYICQL